MRILQYKLILNVKVILEIMVLVLNSVRVLVVYYKNQPFCGCLNGVDEDDGNNIVVKSIDEQIDIKHLACFGFYKNVLKSRKCGCGQHQPMKIFPIS